MPKYFRLLLCIGLAAALAGCSGDDYKDFQKLLDRNIAQWESQELDEYAFSYERSCFCTPLRQSSLVEDGEVIRSYDNLDKVFIPNDDLEDNITIEDLFALVQEAIDREADALSVEFNEDFGYPVRVAVNFSYATADDEISYELTSFSSGPHVASQYYLDIASTAWETEYYSDYSFNYSLDCVCAPNFNNIDVVVEDGEVASATDENSLPLPSADLLLIPTPDDLFISIQEWIDDEVDVLEVEFDETTGFPLLVSVTPDETQEDGSLVHVLADFSPDLLISNQNKLDTNMALWLSKINGSYDYSVETEETGELLEFWITVRNNVATSGHYHDEDDDHIDINPNVDLDYPTIADYFELIQDSIDTPADIILVDYNKKLGFPRSILIDPDATVAGDELEYRIKLYF